MRRCRVTQLRQIHERDIRRAEHCRRGQTRRPRVSGRHVVDVRIRADGLDRALAGVGDARDPVFADPPVMVEGHHIARVEPQHRWRQAGRHGFPPGPCFEQRPAAAPIGFFERRGQRKALGGDAVRRDGGPSRLHRCRVVFLVGANHLPFQRLGKFGLLAAHKFHHFALPSDQTVGPDGGGGRAAAGPKQDPAAALDGIEAEVARQHRDRGARAFERGHGEARHDVGKLGDVHESIRQPSRPAQVPDQCAERYLAEPAAHPVPEPPVGGVRPDIRTGRKIRVGPGVPGPERGLADLDHRLAVNARDRVVGRIAPVSQRGHDIGALDRLVLPAAREMRQRAFRRLRIVEHIGLVGAAIHSRAAELGEADRLGLGCPWGWCRALDTPGAVMMLIGPPGADVLGAENPWLAIGEIRDRRSDLGFSVRIGIVEPVVSFPALDIGLQVAEIPHRRPADKPVVVVVSVAPVGNREVIVDADEIDAGVGPQRVEMEKHVARAILRMMAEILAPVGGIADLRAGPENGAHVGCQQPERRDRREAGGAVADGSEATQLRADQEGVHPARRCAEMGIVQDHPPVAPVIAPGPSDALARHREVRDLRIAEEGGDLRSRRGRLVDRASKASRRRTGDAPAPWVGRLARRRGVVAVGVGQAVALGNVHQQERIEGDP